MKNTTSPEQSRKILVCDDDEGIAEVMKVMLEGAGYTVAVVSNGKAIKKRVESYKPDLVLLDVWLPGIDGKEITKILKRDKNLSHVPVVVVSALNDTQKIAKSCGADDFLEKPFDMDTLLNLAKKYTS